MSMTEAEWLACGDAGEMLPFLLQEHAANGRKIGRRRLRLFGCASCRLLCDSRTDPRSLAAIETIEKFADGGIDAARMAEIEKAAHRALRDIDIRPPEGTRRNELPGFLAAEAAFNLVTKLGGRADWCAWVVFRTSAHIQAFPGLTTDPGEQQRWAELLRAMAHLLRDIWGNPFRPAPVARSRLAAAAVSLSQAAYDERILPSGHLENDRLAVLSNALEEGGCTDVAILEHLRSPGPHVRGWWVLDLVLGRERNRS